MKNSTVEVIMSRRSAREYKPEQVEESLLTAVIEAGRAAPSGGNEQRTHLIVIQNADVLREIIKVSKREFAKIVPDENTYESICSTIEYAKDPDFHFDFLYGAPTLIVVANEKGHTNAMPDSICVLENMIIAAAALELGSCYLNALHWLDDREDFRAYMYTLGLGKNETIAGSLLLGYSAEKPHSPLPRTGNPVTYVR